MGLVSKYNPADVEGKWYQYWLEYRLFSSKPDGREPYATVIPSPNVTDVLYMGHMLNNIIQDILVRHVRMEGKNACWMPGTDYASTVTKAKVVNKLVAQGIKKIDLTRNEFLKHVRDWTEEHGGIILKQLCKLGASCDWDRTAFTMDGERNESILKVFVDLYNKGLIYHGARMVNWGPKALTALSDEEVIYREEHGKPFYLRYKVEGDPEGRYAVVATTHPETIMGDMAMCIDLNGPKNAWLKGKKVIVPLVNRVIPVIEDDYADIEFSTGCPKVTPAHDVNDYMLGEKYNLPSVDISNDNGALSEVAGLYIGMDRSDVRKQIEKDLDAAGLFEKTEAYTNEVGRSERINIVIEPKLSMQWFLKMQYPADMTLPPVVNDELRFYPVKYKNTYHHRMESIKDWRISHQLWWGHRIPAYFLSEGSYVVAVTPEEVLVKTKEKTGNVVLTMDDLRQDEDCLDTWPSSWLWPISLFDGINHPGNEEVSYYYSTSDLATGPDIIFFRVVRMIMAGYEYEEKMPFKNVYFTGIARDKLGRKMFKPPDNSSDPLRLIGKYGVDGVRMGMMPAAPAGNDTLFDDVLCEQGRSFCSKIRSAFRLIKGWMVDDNIQAPDTAKLAVYWFESKQNEVAAEVVDLFSKYRLSEALMAVYKLFWDEFSSWYLEIIKPAYGQGIDRTIYSATFCFPDNLLYLLHLFTSFIIEELWQQMYERNTEEGESLMVSASGMDTYVDTAFVAQFEMAKGVISNIRSIRLQKSIVQKEPLGLQVPGENPVAEFNAVTQKMCNLFFITVVKSRAEGASSFMIGTTEYAVSSGNMIDVEAEIARTEAELKHREGFLQGVLKKLSNERFVNNAPAAVLEIECKKQADTESIISSLKENIAVLKKV